MERLTPDRFAQIILGAIASAALAFSGVQGSDASSCRDLLQDERHAGQQREIRDSDLCSDAIEAVRDICRDVR